MNNHHIMNANVLVHILKENFQDQTLFFPDRMLQASGADDRSNRRLATVSKFCSLRWSKLSSKVCETPSARLSSVVCSQHWSGRQSLDFNWPGSDHRSFWFTTSGKGRWNGVGDLIHTCHESGRIQVGFRAWCLWQKEGKGVETNISFYVHVYTCKFFYYLVNFKG